MKLSDLLWTIVLPMELDVNIIKFNGSLLLPQVNEIEMWNKTWDEFVSITINESLLRPHKHKR